MNQNGNDEFNDNEDFKANSKSINIINNHDSNNNNDLLN